jgi:hypothetical protein
MMAGRSPAEPGSNELGVLISAGAGEPDHLVLLGIPANGRVHLREWSAHNWAGPPDERDLPVDAAYAIFERAHDARRRMTVGLKQVREWLDGRSR